MDKEELIDRLHAHPFGNAKLIKKVRRCNFDPSKLKFVFYASNFSLSFLFVLVIVK